MARPNAIATHVASTTSRRQSRSASSRSSAFEGVRGGKSGFSKEALRRQRQPAAGPAPLPADSADTLLYSTDTLLSKQAEFKKNTVALLRAEGPVPLGQLFARLQKRLGMTRDLRLAEFGATNGLRAFVTSLGLPLEIVPCTEENLTLNHTGTIAQTTGAGELCVRLSRGPCKHFARRGNCADGEMCRFSHVSMAAAGAPSPAGPSLPRCWC